VPVFDTTGRWQIVQAHRLHGAVAPDAIAITFAVATPAQLAPLVMAAAGLTPREQEITALVLAGLPTTEIASAAHIAPYTVQDHLRGVFRKLAVADRHQLTARLLHRPVR
jgi:DNA-binding CsgD family transcriptional regulator